MSRQAEDNRPVPIIDLARCTGCGLCVLVCCTRTLALQNGVAAVANPQTCTYKGYCERICPAQAISRLFEIIRLYEEEIRV